MIPISQTENFGLYLEHLSRVCHKTLFLDHSFLDAGLWWRTLWFQSCSSVSVTPFSQDWLITFFWFFAWSQDSINTKKRQKNSYFAQSGVNGPFLVPKSTLLNFYLYLFLRFFLKLYLMKDIKKCVKVTEMGHFWTQNQHFSTLDLLIRFFWKWCLMTH